MAGKDYTSKSSDVGLTDLGGGLNSTASALSLADNELSDVQNIDFDVFGSAKKRNGYTTLNSVTFNSSAACTGLYDTDIKLSGASAITTYLVGAFEDKLAKMDGLDGTWDEITISGATITAGANLLMDFTQLNDTLIMTNGTDVPIKWTGTGNASPADVPANLTKSKFTASWNNYTFYANITLSSTGLHDSRVYWSNLKDPTTWTATDFLSVQLGDGEPITGMAPLGDRLVIFKETTIHNIFFTGDSDIPFIVVKSKSEVGAASGYSIQKINNGLKFLAYDGFYFYDGNNSTKTSDRITATLDGLAKNRFQYACSGFLRNKNLYWCSLTSSGSSSHDTIITWNSVKQAYSVYDGINANAIEVLRTSGQERIYFGDYAGFAYRGDTGTSDNPLGVATLINAYFKTKWFSFGNIVDKKGVPHVVIYHTLSSATLTFGYSYDLESGTQNSQSIFIGTSGDVYGSSTYGDGMYAASGGAIKRRDLTGRGRLVRLEFSNAILNETFQIDALGLYVHLETVK